MTMSAAAAALGFALASYVTPQLRLRESKEGPPYPRASTYPAFEAPPGDDNFHTMAYEFGFDQLVLYHGFGPSMRYAKQADILFTGGSRNQHGFFDALLVEKAAARGLKVFSIGTGHAERVRFALDLIRRFNLRPKVVVIEATPFYFTDTRSDAAQAAAEMSRWEAAKTWLEVSFGYRFRLQLHGDGRLPKLDYFDRGLHWGWVVYRSWRTGWWRVAAGPDRRYSVGHGKELKSYDFMSPMAEELFEELERRGAVPVVTAVPFTRTWLGHLDFLEERFDVPVIRPEMEGLTASDGSHLDQESARKFTEQIWSKLETIPEVRARLGWDEAKSRPSPDRPRRPREP